MNYEKAEHEIRAGQTDKQSSKITKKNVVGSENDRILKRKIWDITTAVVSLRARSEKFVEGITCAGRERSDDCKIACKYEQAGKEIEKEKEKQYQQNYDRIVEGLPKTKWDIRRFIDDWNLSMNLIG